MGSFKAAHATFFCCIPAWVNGRENQPNQKLSGAHSFSERAPFVVCQYFSRSVVPRFQGGGRQSVYATHGRGSSEICRFGNDVLHIRKKYHLGRASVEGTHWGDVVFAMPDGKLLLEVREGIETFAILLSMWY